ncbi:MAG: ABC transporter permease [Candidatus Dormibacteraeota bacterium]|nr:ABC transporter permease [Candidatus Dormibacteraeota bacterium]MDQ6899575.1 ABC transporter permease [Candidatus Dormibacteraeota bacterium]
MKLLIDAAAFVLHNPQLLAEKALQQLLLSAVSLVVAIAIALPVGIVTGHLHRGGFLAISGGNIARALPSLAVIAIGIPLWGLGFVNIMITLVVLAIPAILTNTYVAVSTVKPATVEAARGMGMRRRQVLARVELPVAVPLMVGGIRTASVFVIATAYLASFAGSGNTLGTIISQQGFYGLSGVLAATAVTVVMAFSVEGVLALCQRWLTPKGLRLLRSEGGGPYAGRATAAAEIRPAQLT